MNIAIGRKFAMGCTLLAMMISLAVSLPAQVTVCDVLKKPSKFNGKQLTITGVVHVGFEQFVISGPGCGSIWIDYPDMPTVVPKADFKLNRTKKFDAFAQALRDRDVKATILGRLDGVDQLTPSVEASRVNTVREGKKHDVKHPPNGFGHLDQYRARLVIREVVELNHE